MATGRTNAKGAGGSPGPSPAPYTPPADWINIDTITDGNVHFLVADGGLNTFAFKCSTSTGTYHVDWGDGSSADFASSAKAEHTYTEGTGQACSRGYTTFKIVIQPNSGNLLTVQAVAHSLATQTQQLRILSCVIAARYLTSLANVFATPSGTAIRCVWLEQCKITVPLGVCLSSSYMFMNCQSLQSVAVSGLVAVTNASYMFHSCYALQSIDTSPMINVTDASSMFSGCFSLESVNISGMTKITNASNMFSNCISLKSADVSALVNLTNATSMFYACYLLESVDTSPLVKITNAYNMFSNCYRLQSADVSTLVNITDASGMFGYCYLLRSVDISALVKVTNATSMFAGCLALQSVTAHGLVDVTNASSMFQNCYAFGSFMADDFSKNAAGVTFADAFNGCQQLVTLDLSDAKVTAFTAKGSSGNLNKLTTLTMHASSLLNAGAIPLDISYTSLPASLLNTIFTSLPTVTSKTIIATGCVGAVNVSKSIGCTIDSEVVTATNTSGVDVGMEVMGSRISGNHSVTFQDAGNTVTRTGVRTFNDTIVYFSSITTTTGIVIKTPYYAVNSSGFTFQLSLTQGGSAIDLTSDGTGVMNYSTTVVSVNPNVSITLSTPVISTGVTSHNFSALKRSVAIGKGWTVNG